jgi:hypothetical protein
MPWQGIDSNKSSSSTFTVRKIQRELYGMRSAQTPDTMWTSRYWLRAAAVERQYEPLDDDEKLCDHIKTNDNHTYRARTWEIVLPWTFCGILVMAFVSSIMRHTPCSLSSFPLGTYEGGFTTDLRECTQPFCGQLLTVATSKDLSLPSLV